MCQIKELEEDLTRQRAEMDKIKSDLDYACGIANGEEMARLSRLIIWGMPKIRQLEHRIRRAKAKIEVPA